MFFLGDGKKNELVDAFIAHGFDVNTTDSKGENLLFCVVKTNQFERVAYLVGLGIDLSQRNQEGQTVIDLANTNGNKQLLEFFQQKVSQKNYVQILRTGGAIFQPHDSKPAPKEPSSESPSAMPDATEGPKKQ